MNKELTPLEVIEILKKRQWVDIEHYTALCEFIETALKDYEKKLEQAQEDKEMLDIFKNALTVERDIPPELEIKESEKGCSYVFKEAVKIHENRIEEMLKKSLREWVLKNAFPKELKALEIIKEKRVDVNCFLIYDLERYNSLIAKNEFMKLTQDEFDLLKEVLL